MSRAGFNRARSTVRFIKVDLKLKDKNEAHLSPIVVRRKFATDVIKEAAAQGGMTVLVDGLPGMGKTFFLRELITAAQQSNQWQVTFVRADEIESAERSEEHTSELQSRGHLVC